VYWQARPEWLRYGAVGAGFAVTLRSTLAGVSRGKIVLLVVKVEAGLTRNRVAASQ
jgi:hypothetical protein